MKIRQLAVFGNICNPDKVQALQRLQCEDAWCDRCEVSIRQGRYYSTLLFFVCPF